LLLGVNTGNPSRESFLKGIEVTYREGSNSYVWRSQVSYKLVPTQSC
jgi:hypothetical protein